MDQWLSGDISIHYEWLSLFVVLIFFNWAAEAIKWRILVKELAHIHFWIAYKAVLTGVFVSFFTPNRSGEFAGRIIYLPGKKIEGTILTLTGGLAQNICTLLFGCLAGLIFFASDHLEWMLGATGIIILTAVVLFFYFNIDRLAMSLWYFGLSRKWLRYFLPLRHLKTKTLLSILLISILRYGIYSVQFYLMFLSWGAYFDFAVAMQGIGLFFLIQSIIPSITIMELTSRGITANYIFNQVGIEQGIVLLATYSIWFINLLLPALFGALLFLFNRKSDVDL